MTFDDGFTIRCHKAHLDVWHRYATDHGTNLSELIRVMCDNVTGLNDPPRLDIFDQDELPDFAGHFAGEHKRRLTRSGGSGLMILLTALSGMPPPPGSLVT